VLRISEDGITAHHGRTLAAGRLQVVMEGNRRHQACLYFRGPDSHPRLALVYGPHRVVPAIFPSPPLPDPRIVVHDLTTGRLVAQMTSEGNGCTVGTCLALLANPEGAEGEPLLLAMGGSDGALHVFEAETGALVARISDFPPPQPTDPWNPQPPPEVPTPAVTCLTSFRTPEGETILAAGYSDGGVRLYDLATHANVGQLGGAAGPLQGIVAVSAYAGPAGERILTQDGEGTVRVSPCVASTTTPALSSLVGRLVRPL
jgi:WD40 repeat protein